MTARANRPTSEPSPPAPLPPSRPAPESARGRRWRADLVVVVVWIAAIVPSLVWRPGLVLDDWFALGNAAVDGPWSSAGRDQWLARPGAGLTYALTFGVFGVDHSWAYLLLQVLLLLATALVVRRLVDRLVIPAGFRPPTVRSTIDSDGWHGTLVASVWLLVANHTSLVAWPSAINIAVAVLLTTVAWKILQRRGPPLVAGVVLAAASLCYEAVLPAGLAVGVWLWWAGQTEAGPGRTRPRRAGRGFWRAAAGFLVPPIAAAAWAIAFWHPAKRGIDESIDLGRVIAAHLAWGVLPDGPPVVVVGTAACVVLSLVVVRALDPRRRPRRWRAGESMAVAGTAVVVLGTLPFVRYFYQPLGAGDRVNAIAGFGTALVWSGLALTVLHWAARLTSDDRFPDAVRHLARPTATILVVTVAALFVVSHVQSAQVWASAGEHARRQLESAERQAGRSDGRAPAGGAPCSGTPTAHNDARIRLTTGPVRRNVAALLDRSNALGMARVVCGTGVDAASVELVHTPDS